MRFSWYFSIQAQWLGFGVGAVIILIGTLAPAADLVPVPGGDKLHHIVGFLGWSSLCALGPTRRFVLMTLAIFIIGGLIELVQPYVNRHADWYDLWADGVGICLAYFVHALARVIKRLV